MLEWTSRVRRALPWLLLLFCSVAQLSGCEKPTGLGEAREPEQDGAVAPSTAADGTAEVLAVDIEVAPDVLAVQVLTAPPPAAIAVMQPLVARAVKVPDDTATGPLIAHAGSVFGTKVVPSHLLAIVFVGDELWGSGAAGQRRWMVEADGAWQGWLDDVYKGDRAHAATFDAAHQQFVLAAPTRRLRPRKLAGPNGFGSCGRLQRTALFLQVRRRTRRARIRLAARKNGVAFRALSSS